MKNFIKKITGHSLFTGSSFVFASSMISNVAAYLYHLIIGRILGPVGYGELSSLISLLYIFGVPTLVLSTVLVKYFSVSKAHHDLGSAADLLKRTTKMMCIVLLGVGIVLLLVSPFLTSFLHLSNWTMVMWVFFIFVFSSLSIIPVSLLQGLQWFFLFGLFSALPTVLKLILSIPFSYQGVEWTLIAFVLSGVISYILLFFPLRSILRMKIHPFILTKTKVVRDGIPTLLALIGITSLYSMDIVLVRHFFPSETSGIYAALAVLGKIIFYATSAVAMVVYPIVAERKEKQEETKKIILLSLFGVMIISICLTCVYGLFPLFITHLLFGPSYNEASQYLGLFGVFMSLFSISYLLTLISLALGKLQVWIFTLAAAGIQICAIIFYHVSILQILWINIGVTIVLCIGLSTWVFLKHE